MLWNHLFNISSSNRIVDWNEECQLRHRCIFGMNISLKFHTLTFDELTHIYVIGPIEKKSLNLSIHFWWKIKSLFYTFEAHTIQLSIIINFNSNYWFNMHKFVAIIILQKNRSNERFHIQCTVLTFALNYKFTLHYGHAKCDISKAEKRWRPPLPHVNKNTLTLTIHVLNRSFSTKTCTAQCVHCLIR